MDTIWTVLSLWLHGLATVVMLGFFLLMQFIFLPYFEEQAGGEAAEAAVNKIYGRFMPWVAAAFVVFIASGIYLMLRDPHYPGFGRIFANAWAAAMAIKHVVVVLMLAIGGWLNIALRRGAASAAHAGGRETGQISRVKLALSAMNLCAASVLLLTAIAQSV